MYFKLNVESFVIVDNLDIHIALRLTVSTRPISH